MTLNVRICTVLGAVSGAVKAWMLCLATCLASTLLLPSLASGAQIWGFNESSNQEDLTNQQAERVATLDEATGSDARRMVISWNVVEPRVNGGRDWRKYDRQIEALDEIGVQPLIVLISAPSWTYSLVDCTGLFCPPDRQHLDEWASFAAAVARRYPHAAGIQLWNEPNIEGQWTTLAGPEPERYAELFYAGAEAIQATDPDIPVITGSVTYVEQNQNGVYMTIPTFLNRFYAAGGGNLLRAKDGVGINAYPWITELETFDGPFATILAQGRGVLSAQDPGRKLWITETGVTTTGPFAVSQEDQARGVVGVAREIREMNDVAAFFIHTLIEPPAHGSFPYEEGFGLLRRDANVSTKLAYCALAEDVGAPRAVTGCPADVLEDLGMEPPDNPPGGGDGCGADLLDLAISIVMAPSGSEEQRRLQAEHASRLRACVPCVKSIARLKQRVQSTPAGPRKSRLRQRLRTTKSTCAPCKRDLAGLLGMAYQSSGSERAGFLEQYDQRRLLCRPQSPRRAASRP